ALELGSPCVVVREPPMLLAVEFKDELGCAAVKIDNVSVDRNLAWIPGSEPGDRAMKTRSAQPSPMSSARAGCLRKARANWRRSGGAAFGSLTPAPSPDGRGPLTLRRSPSSRGAVERRARPEAEQGRAVVLLGVGARAHVHQVLPADIADERAAFARDDGDVRDVRLRHAFDHA